MGPSLNPKRGDSMDKFNPMQYVDVKTLPVALQRGLDMLLRPADTWAQVRAEEGSATTAGLLLGYALWWVLWAVLGGLVVTLLWGLGLLALIPGATALLGVGKVVGAQVGLAGVAFVLTTAAWAAVMQLFSWCAVIFIMCFAVQFFAKQKDGTPQPTVRLLQLVVYAMTPVWLLAPLMSMPVLGTWAMYGAAGYGLYLTHLGLAALSDKPTELGVIDIVMLAALAMLVALIFNGLGWLALIGGGVWLFARGQYKLNEALATQDAREEQDKANAKAQAEAKTETKPETAGSASAFNAMGDHAASAMHNMPAHEPSKPAAPPAPPAPPAPVASAPAVNASKIAALDKKIVKATAQGDMAEVSRLMGERGVLLQSPNNDF
jgi:hypothetical protein